MEQSSHFSWRYPLALAAVLVLSACGRPRNHPRHGGAQGQRRRSHRTTAERVGRIHRPPGGPESVELRPRVSGYIDRVAFHEGALVKKGDLLFQIDPRPFEAEVKRLEAQLQQARAAQARSVNEAQRGERLRASNRDLRGTRRRPHHRRPGSQGGGRRDPGATGRGAPEPELHPDHRADRRSRQPRRGHRRQPGQLRETLLTTLVSTDKVYAYFDADERVFLKYVELARQAGRDTRSEARSTSA